MIELEECRWTNTKRERERDWNYTLVMQRHDCVDQTLTVLSSPAETNSFPLAPKRMALMLSVWKGEASESSVKETAEPALRVYQYNKWVEVKWENEVLLTGGRRREGDDRRRRLRSIGRGERRWVPEQLLCPSWFPNPCCQWETNLRLRVWRFSVPNIGLSSLSVTH